AGTGCRQPAQSVRQSGAVPGRTQRTPVLVQPDQPQPGQDRPAQPGTSVALSPPYRGGAQASRGNPGTGRVGGALRYGTGGRIAGGHAGTLVTGTARTPHADAVHRRGAA